MPAIGGAYRDEFVTPDPHEPLRVGDRLFVAGPREMVADLTF